MNDTCLSTSTPGTYSNVTSSNSTRPSTSRHRCLRRVGLILRRHLADFANAIQAGERFTHLRADRRHLHERRRHEPTKNTYIDEIAERHRAGEDRPAADDDHQHADDAGDHRCARANRRGAGDRLGDVAKQLVRAAREHESLARFGDVHFHETNAADRFRQASGDFGVDRAALAKQRTQLG